MAERPNGLASLTHARERARRTMPPPRHPAPRRLDSVPEVPDAVDAKTASRTDEPQEPADETHPGQRPDGHREPEAASPGRTPTPTAVQPPVKLTFYVDEELDRYLENVRIQGLTARPKVDISRSAVVRLALRRLQDEMTPEQVKTLLAAQPTETGRTGRKRR